MAIPTPDNQEPNTESAEKFPKDEDQARLDTYERFDLEQAGEQFRAFNIELENDMYKKWGKLRYIVTNYAGLISKVISDMLFSEEVKFKYKDSKNQEFSDALVFNNKLHVQNQESAFANSARGDAIYKIRIGKRYPTDEKSSIIIEDISPYIYFPRLDEMNMRNQPAAEELSWFVIFDNKTYIRKEIHSAGLIQNELYDYNKSKKQLGGKVVWQNFYPDEPEVIETKINRNLIVHVPNFRKGTQFFGTSDYADLESLFFAINNRMTKVHNILDKHSDPILAIPEGVLDEEGEVRRDRVGLFEVPSESGAKPEYIVWNANLEAAFKEIERLDDAIMVISETAPDVVGKGKGQSDSGRALKFKLLRTIAKKKRKERYYSQALKEVMTIAQELAIEWGIDSEMDGKVVKRPKRVETPDIEFGEGYVQDTFEAAQEEQIRSATGNTTLKDQIMRLDGLDDEAAEEKVKEIRKDEGLNLPLTDDFVEPDNDGEPQDANPTQPPLDDER